MWRLLILALLLLLVIFYLIFRPGQVLKLAASVLYSPISPLSHNPLPVWASYYLKREVFEGPPVLVRQLEEDVRVIGYALLAVPIALAVTVALIGG